MKELRIIVFLSLLVCLGNHAYSKQIIMKSPNNQIVIELENADKKIAYLVKKANETILDTGSLDIVVNNERLSLNSGIYVKKKYVYKKQHKLLGVKSKSKYYANNYIIGFREKNTKTEFNIEFSLSNEGIAFRYICINDKHNFVKNEESIFKFKENPVVWFAERNNSWKLKTYAGEFKHCFLNELHTISPMGPIQMAPLLFENSNGTYTLLTEAALYDYSGMRLEALGNNSIRTNFTEGEKGFEVKGDVITPWRVLIIADNLNSLVNNNMIAGLNPAYSKKLFKNRDWIKPGIALTSFFSTGVGTPIEERNNVDIVAKLKLDYLLIDDGWEKWENKWENLEMITRYAKNKKIGIWAWKHSDEIINKKDNYYLMRSFIDTLSNIGVQGVKVDFMNSEDKSTIDFEIALLEYTASKRIMVNFHGCHKPTGESIKYPNELTREGIRGWELNGMKEGPIGSTHNTALPFTRCILGNADYTPLCYTAPGNTTWAHQLATLISFTSPFLCIPEDPAFLVSDTRVSSFNSILSKLPTVWDETLVLPGSKIGETAILARRYKNDWYVAVLNAEKGKTIDIKLDFLKKKKYKTEIFSDDLEAKPIDITGLNKKIPVDLHGINTAIPFKKTQVEVKRNSIISLEIARNGGAFIKLTTQ